MFANVNFIMWCLILHNPMATYLTEIIELNSCGFFIFCWQTAKLFSIASRKELIKTVGGGGTVVDFPLCYLIFEVHFVYFSTPLTVFCTFPVLLGSCLVQDCGEGAYLRFNDCSTELDQQRQLLRSVEERKKKEPKAKLKINITTLTDSHKI